MTAKKCECGRPIVRVRLSPGSIAQPICAGTLERYRALYGSAGITEDQPQLPAPAGESQSSAITKP